jgi:hypothetical protein
MNMDHQTKSVGLAAFLSVLLAGLSFASSGCESDERCVPRETQICSCAPDRQGVQTCEASGNAYTVCDCAEPGDAGLADTSEAEDTSTASDVADVESADSSDVEEDTAEHQNPAVELVRELTFEQPDGTNGWSDPAGVVFNWQDHPTGRHLVPDAQVRGATGINPPDISTTVAYRGERSAHFTMKPWSGSTYRTDMEMLGNRNASPPIERVFHQGTTHLVGFAMRIEHATFDKQSSGDFP